MLIIAVLLVLCYLNLKSQKSVIYPAFFFVLSFFRKMRSNWNYDSDLNYHSRLRNRVLFMLLILLKSKVNTY